MRIIHKKALSLMLALLFILTSVGCFDTGRDIVQDGIEIAEEPHLHFEMTVSDLSVDPLEYFDEKALEALGLDASHGE